MKIEINNLTKEKIDCKLLEKVVKIFGQVYKIHPVKSRHKAGSRGEFNGVKNKEISIAFVSDAEIKKINFTYRGINKATDVLSFAGEGEYLGEIIIDYNQIKRQAADFKNSAEQELIFVLVHGLLHLLGYDDKKIKEREDMIKRGEKFIKNLKI